MRMPSLSPGARTVPETSRPAPSADGLAGGWRQRVASRRASTAMENTRGSSGMMSPLVSRTRGAGDGADEVGDQGGGDGDAEGLEPQPEQDPGGAGELEGGQDGEVADRDADGPADDGDRPLVLAELLGGRGGAHGGEQDGGDDQGDEHGAP